MHKLFRSKLGQFFIINEPPGLPHLTLKLLNKVGIGETGKMLHRFLPVYLWFIFAIAVPKTCYSYDSFEASIVGLAELFFQFNNFTGLLLIFGRNEKVQCLIQTGRQLANEVLQCSHDDMRQLLAFQHKRMHNWTRVYCLLIFITVNIFAVAPICATFWSYYRVAHQNTTAQHVLHMEENFYGLKIRSSLREYLIYAFTMLPTSYLCAFVGMTKIMTVFNFTNYCTVYFELVSLQLRNQNRAQIQQTNIGKVVKMHQLALRCADLLETIVSPIMLMQVVLCVLIMSSMMLYFTYSNIGGHMINVLLLFVVVTTETFGYCYLGTQLSLESEQVGYAVYSVGWEQQSSEIMKQLQLILVRAQKPIGITAGKFSFINMEQFTQLVKTTYSVFILLKDLL